ncbi:MAG: murein hydrolase activator EnvC family protein [Solirubrobacteraceae bacterium]
MSRRPLLRRLLISVSLLLVAAAPAAADLGSQKHAVADRIAALHNRIDAARAHEQALTAQIGSVTTRIRSLEAQVGDVSTRLGTLQEDLTLHRTRLAKIQSLYQLQTQQLRFLKRQYAVAVKRLDQRLVSAYETGEPSTIEVLLGARNLQDMLDQIDYLNRIANQDKQIVAQVAGSRGQMRQARLRTAKMQTTVAAETRVISYRTAQQAAIRDQLLAARGSLSSARDAKQHDLAATSAQERQWTSEADSLSAVSAQLTAQIQAAQAVPPATTNPGDNSSPPSSGTPAAPSSAGLIWPVSGPITSPFGMRWGSLHPGIDIGVPMGTPIKAAAAGTVIVAAYSGGYGNLVVIDHGNGLATAYAHQSQIAVSVGQRVTQGQVIGYVGSTGFSTGPHLHFEVRVNGSPVDPMGYL